jgi:hypothetical protein
MFMTFRSPISPLLDCVTTENSRSIEQANILTTPHEYLNRSTTIREYSTGWNGFYENFPSFTETFNFPQRNQPETFENLMFNFGFENADEILRKLDDTTIMPRDENIYKILVEKVILKPELVDSIVEVFKKVLRLKNLPSNNLNFNASSSIIKIIIANKLEVVMESAGKDTSVNTQLFCIIQLVQKLYMNAIISKHCVHYIIDLIKINEKNKFVETYATMLEKVLESKKCMRNIELNGSDPNNSEMTSSGEWSDFDSETSRHGVFR